MQNEQILPLADSDFQYQLDLYRASNIGGVYTIRMDEQFTLLYGNDLYFKVHEYAPEELLGKSCALFIHPQDLGYVRQVLSHAWEQRIKNVELETRIITGKKNIKHMLVSGSFNTRNGEDVFDGYIMDITRSKNMEQELRESEEKFRIATENSDIAFWTYYFARKEIVQTASSQRVHGHETVVKNVPEALVQSEFIRADSAEALLKMYRDLEQGAKTASGDFWTKSLSGDDWWCERIEYTTVFDENGLPKYAHAIGRDVTAEKIKEIQYNEELSYKNAIVSKDFIGSMQANLSTGEVEKIVSPNEWFHDIYSGKSFDECIKTLGKGILDKKQREHFLSAVQSDMLLKDFKNGCTQKDFRLQRKLGDGTVRWILTSVKLLKKPSSEHIAAFLYGYDINREEIFKRSMKQLARSSYDLIGCINGINDTYTLLSGQKNHTDFTQKGYEQAIRTFLKAHKSSLTNLTCVTVDFIVEELKTKTLYSLAFTQKDSMGAIRSKQLRFAYIDRQSKTILFTLTDFTDVVNKERAHQETLQTALNAAEKANAAKSEFLSCMSHDMRTPMNGIIGLTNLTLDLPHLPEEARQNLIAIGNSSSYLLSLINDTLDMSRIESNKLTLNPESVNAGQLLDSISAYIKPLTQEKNITFEIIPINSEYVAVWVDKVRFQQIFINVLSNAVKFTPAGGKIQWIIECLKRENGIAYDRFVVRDTGVGMSADFLPRLFEPFEQEQHNITTNYTGTGLGMSIVKNLVEKMGGSIEVKSAPGVGTEVIIYLNFKRMADTESEHYLSNGIAQNLTGKRILLCEDHPLNMQIACKLLEKQGMMITTAQNGREGIDAFVGAPLSFFDAILMDIRMPVMDGLAATKSIRLLNRPDAQTVPIIAMTANAFDEDIQEAKQAGMNAHLAKPVDPQVLYKTLEGLISHS